jgi:short-subunit dehydrogenase
MSAPEDGKDLTGKWAVVTGASSGLGVDFSEILAGRGCSLIAVARRRDRLEQLRARLESQGVTVHVLPLDLSEREAPAQLFNFTQEKGIAVDFLINNAGFGKVGPFLDSSWEYDEALLHVNVRAVHHLTKLFATAMVARGSGRILNVASAAGFRPMANFAAYAASKAYVLHLSEALSVELEGTGVRVSTLCPGPTTTEFFDATKDSEPLSRMGMMESGPVAREGIELMLRGDPVRVVGALNRAMIRVGLFLPRRWVARFAGKMLEKREL